jgi:hypothetical protein
MITLDVKQGSPEWLQARLGIPTASEFDALVTPLWKVREGDGVESYLARKLAEKWRGEPLMSFSGGAMEQGQALEEEAIPWYEFEHGVQITRVGFATTDDGRIGCSPDGLLDGGGIEIKCPECHTHTRYLLDGVLPKAYAAQVHGNMLVTGAAQWTFLSYCRGFPPLLLVIRRDQAAQDALRKALDTFNARLDAAYARLCEFNGGPPEPRPDPQQAMRDVFGLSDSQGEL